jgi:hypothetical protein
MPRCLRALVASACVVALLGGGSDRAYADAPATATASVPPRIDFTIVAPAAIEVEVEPRVLSWFRGQNTTVRAIRADALDAAAVLARSADAGIRAWIDLKDPVMAHVFFSVEDPHSGRRFLVSDVPLPGGLDELGIEQLAQVVYLSAQALWDGNVESSRQEVEAGLRRREADEKPPSSVTFVPPPPDERPLLPVPMPQDEQRVVVGSGYSLRSMGDEGDAQALGSSAGVVWRQRQWETGARLRADLFLPREQGAGAGVKVELQGLGLGAGLTLARRASREVWITGEVGPGLDMVRYHAGSIEVPGLRPTSGGVSPRPNGQLRLGVRIDLGSVSLVAESLLVVQFLGTHYDVTQGSAHSKILVPGIVQPGFAVGLSW